MNFDGNPYKEGMGKLQGIRHRVSYAPAGARRGPRLPTVDIPGKSAENLDPRDSVRKRNSPFGVIGVSSKRSSQSNSPTVGSEAPVDHHNKSG